MILDVKVKAQFQPRSALDVLAVVLAKRKTPVIAGSTRQSVHDRMNRLSDSHTSRDGEATSATHVRHLDHVSREQSTRYPDDTQDDLLKAWRAVGQSYKSKGRLNHDSRCGR